MKIAFIGQKGIPTRSGGVEKHVENLAVRLAEHGHQVTVYVRPHYTDRRLAQWKGVRLISLPSLRTKHLDAISHTALATVHALFQRYDVIHYQSIGPSLLAIVPRLLIPKTLVIATFHSRDYFHKKWNIAARLYLRLSEWMTCRVPEKTVVISETLKAYAEREYGKEFVLIPNGAEVHPETDEAFLKPLGLKTGRYVLSVSRLVRHKGIHYLIKAFQGLKETAGLPGNNFKLVIVGTHAETADYEAYLKFLANGDPDILFLGERSGRELAALFTQAAVFVQPSEDEGLSLALLEAMGYGLPCVVSDIPANCEAIKETGITFPSTNIEALKRVLGTLINHAAERKRLGALAEERARTEYAWEAIARRTEALYAQLLEKRHRSAHTDAASVMTHK